MKRKTDYWWMKNTLKQYVYEDYNIDRKDPHIGGKYIKQDKKTIDYIFDVVDPKGK